MANDTNSPPPRNETTVGNYFVANYPPFSFWSPDNIPDALAALDTPPAPGRPLGMYLHIPFCRKRCHFCYFKVYTDKNASEINAYLDAMKAEFEMLAARPFVGGRKPQFVYFGGGTPSYLSPSQLRGLVDAIQARMPWDEAEEIAFEAEPGTLTEAKLRMIREIGVTRLSLGIENFDDHILDVNGRAHRAPEIGRAYDYARSIGFPQINIDLIAGMINETDDNWKRNIEKTIEMQPDCITIYQMEIPFNTTIYKEMKEGGKVVAPVADWETKRRWVAEAFAALEEAGYTVTSGYTAVRDPKHTRFIYRDSLWSGADMLSLGVSAFGFINGTHMQNEKDIGPYIAAIKAGRLPISRALRIDEEEAFIRQFVLQMKLGRIHREYFRERFGIDVRERFGDEFKELAERGDVALSDGFVVLSRAALLRADELLIKFFLPQHQHARYT